MPNFRPLPPPLTLGPFRFAKAVQTGVARSRLRAPDVLHPHHGLYAPRSEPLGLVDQCQLLLPLLGPGHWVSHVTAARLWGIPFPRPWTPQEPLHVIALGEAEPMRRPNVVGWVTGDVDLPRTVFEDIPVIRPADAWCQLAVHGALGVDEHGRRRRLADTWLVAAGDYLLTGAWPHRRPLCTRAELVEAIARRRGKRGAKALAWAIDRVRPGVHSPKETQLRLALVAQGLPEPQTQVEVVTAEGLFHADLGYPEKRLLLEYQGDQHRTDRGQWLHDLTRVQLFQDAGFHVLLVGADDLYGPRQQALARRVRRALEGRPFRA